MLANNAASTECRQHLQWPIEVGHFDVCRANTLRIVGVRSDPGRNRKLLHKFDGLEVVDLVLDFGVEHFDNIKCTGARQRFQDRSSHPGANRIERVRRVHEPALRPDAMDHLGDRQHVGNTLRKKQADQLAGRRADLFAHNYAHMEIFGQRRQRRFDTVMIGDAHHVKLRCLDLFSQLVECGTRVSRRGGVQMTIKADPAGWGRWWWPSGIQQRGGA